MRNRLLTLFRLASLSLLALSASTLPAAAAEQTDLAKRLDVALRRGGLRGADVGVLIEDLDSGEVLYARHPDGLYVPASLTKIVTSASALSRLGPAIQVPSGATQVG